MTLAGCALITVIVWAVGMIRPVRWRALAYSLPVPITLVLLLTPTSVDGAQLLGVVLLNVFFVVVAVLHRRYRWHILLADLAGISVYIALAAATALMTWPVAPVLVIVVLAWLLATRMAPPKEREQPPGPSSHWAARLAIIGLGSLPTVALGSLLSGLVVTFPYSGLLVAVESRRDLPDFTRHFARNSLGLIAFFAAYHYSPAEIGGQAGKLLAAWAAFGLCVLVLHSPRGWLSYDR